MLTIYYDVDLEGYIVFVANCRFWYQDFELALSFYNHCLN